MQPFRETQRSHQHLAVPQRCRPGTRERLATARLNDANHKKPDLARTTLVRTFFVRKTSRPGALRIGWSNTLRNTSTGRELHPYFAAFEGDAPGAAHFPRRGPAPLLVYTFFTPTLPHRPGDRRADRSLQLGPEQQSESPLYHNQVERHAMHQPANRRAARQHPSREKDRFCIASVSSWPGHCAEKWAAHSDRGEAWPQ